jgi:hypothetical protein
MATLNKMQTKSDQGAAAWQSWLRRLFVHLGSNLGKDRKYFLAVCVAFAFKSVEC